MRWPEASALVAGQLAGDCPLLSEELFRGVLVRERRRADRSNRPLILIVLEIDGLADRSAADWRALTDTLAVVRRETDMMGWFRHHTSIGLLLPEVSQAEDLAGELREQVALELTRRMASRAAAAVSIQVHVHPHPMTRLTELHPVDPIVSEERPRPLRQIRYDAMKRGLDIAVSLTLLALLSPLLLLIAALVKLTSPGPILFRQERVGQMMKPFRMLKFRTMRPNAGHAIHHDYVSAFIKSGGKEKSAKADGKTLFKIANDPRVTPIGDILRRTSLDELPQLWNVLIGEMSLVGPRPPIQYEVDQYKSWHVRRVLEAKPGLTGLWQVTGRSRTTFDEMVRLDLRYARTYSFRTDLRILLATPRAVISGKGAC